MPSYTYGEAVSIMPIADWKYLAKFLGLSLEDTFAMRGSELLTVVLLHLETRNRERGR
jgi:hypothetical protein